MEKISTDFFNYGIFGVYVFKTMRKWSKGKSLDEK